LLTALVDAAGGPCSFTVATIMPSPAGGQRFTSGRRLLPLGHRPLRLRPEADGRGSLRGPIRKVWGSDGGHPLSTCRCWSWTPPVRLPLGTVTDLVDRSDQQSTATLSLMSLRRREGQSAEHAVGKKRLVKGTLPHATPFVSRRPLTRPRQPPPRRTMRPAGPASIRVGIMSARA
jgi:hypothetical protein